MSKTIEGVPDSIAREQYLSLIAGVGLDAKDVITLRFAADGIYATVCARTASGETFYDPTSGSLAKHEVYIPVKDAEVGA